MRADQDLSRSLLEVVHAAISARLFPEKGGATATPAASAAKPAAASGYTDAAGRLEQMSLR